MNTYKSIALKYELGKIEGARFVAYMTMRRPKDEEIHCRSSYASEWAERFFKGLEYASSDLEGLRVLRAIDTCENCHERLSQDEVLEAIQSNLKLGEVACDDCYQNFVAQKSEELRHPDDKR